MRYFHFNGLIDEQLMDKFLEFINSSDGHDMTIILNSVGGKKNLCLAILDIININSHRVTLISCGAYSASFYLFYKATSSKRKMTEGSVGMMHYSSTDMTMMSNGSPAYLEDENTVKNWKEDTEQLKFVKQFMTDKELRKYKRGSDVYFTFKRMKEIFPDVEII